MASSWHAAHGRKTPTVPGGLTITILVTHHFDRDGGVPSKGGLFREFALTELLGNPFLFVLVIQMKLAAEGLSIPMVKGTADAIQDPFYKALALKVNNSDWICNAMDQLLGRDTGRVFNDEAAAVAVGAQSPEQATKTIEDSWSKNRIYEGS
jgi:hypothetical protein